jgi:1,4-alpha-glucan branching enzyme
MGEFNGWHGESHPMRSGSSGIWSLFVPGLAEYAVYKYRIMARNGESFDKADLYGFGMEQRPKTASVVVNNALFWIDKYHLSDT